MSVVTPQPVESAPSQHEAASFWERFSPHHEFPLANVGSIVVHIVVFGLFLLYVSRSLHVNPKTAPPTRGMTISGDDRESGPAGANNAHAQRDPVDDPRSGDPKVPNVPVSDLPIISPKTKIEFNGSAPPAQPNPGQKERLDKIGKDLENRIGGLTGKNGSKGNGPPSATERRQGRWTLIFQTHNGRDYIAQLAALQPKLVVRTPTGTFLLFNDLNDLSSRKEINKEPTGLMSFHDTDAQSVKRVAEVLKLDFTLNHFSIFIPKDVENDLAAKERAFRGKREDQIKSTVFRVFVRDRKYSVTVTEQELIEN